MPNLSIIIPATGGNELLENGLVTILQHRPASSEVIVVLNRPYDDPYDLKQEISFVEIPSRANLLVCLREGIAASTSPIVHLVGCGWEASEDWAAAALEAFADPLVAAVAPRVCQSAKSAKLRSAGISYAAFGRLAANRRVPKSDETLPTILGPELLASFYRREALQQIGGLPVELSEEAAAVEIALRLRTAGYRAKLAPEATMHPAAEAAYSASSFRRSADAERLFWRHLPTRGRLAALLIHPWLVGGEIALALPRPTVLAKLAGRLWGATALLSASSYRRNLMQLEGLALDDAALDQEDAATLPLEKPVLSQRRHAA